MKKIIGILIALTMLVHSSLSQAKENEHSENAHHTGGISYDYFDIAYFDVETSEESGDGFLLRGMKSFGENFYFTSEYGDTDLTHGDFKFLRFGIGVHNSLSEKIDGIAELTYEELVVNEDHHHFNESGYGLAVGLRALFTESLEGTAKVRYVDFGHEDDVIIGAELLYLLNHNFGFVFSYEDGNETAWSLGIRIQF